MIGVTEGREVVQCIKNATERCAVPYRIHIMAWLPGSGGGILVD